MHLKPSKALPELLAYGLLPERYRQNTFIMVSLRGHRLRGEWLYLLLYPLTANRNLSSFCAVIRAI